MSAPAHPSSSQLQQSNLKRLKEKNAQTTTMSMNSSGDGGGNGGSSSHPCLSARLSCLDRALQRLSDTASASSFRTLLASTSSSSPSSNIFARAAAPPTLQEITDTYAPRTLEKQFEELYRTLHPALVVMGNKNSNSNSSQTGSAATSSIKNDSSNSRSRSNVSAFVQGPRGSGKTLLLNRVLTALADEIRAASSNSTINSRMFRLVYVHGITVPGHSVHTVVREILHQLTDAALHEHKAVVRKNNSNNNSQEDNGGDDDDKAEQFLRLKQTSFTNQLQLLTEILQLACVDGIPVLFVLDELDSFVASSLGNKRKRQAQHCNNNNNNSSNASISTQNAGWTHSHPEARQLLLYHLLERVATQGSFCSLVGLTADSAILTRLEKRIKSRAEGTARFMLTGPCPSYQTDLVPILLDCVVELEEMTETLNEVDAVNTTNGQAQQLRQEISRILLRNNAASSDHDDPAQTIYETLELEHRVGKDMRWFRRVLYHALASYRHDLLQQSSDRASEPLISLTARYFEEALLDMGGSLPRQKSTTGNKNNNTNLNSVIESDLRLQALRDLSGPQVALVLAARRILHRDASRTYNHHNSETAEQPQLTLHRMLHEYQAFFKGHSRYSGSMLRRAFQDLLETGLVRPAADHTGLGPFQYMLRDNHNEAYSQSVDMEPLHLTVDIHREVKRAIDEDAFHCSTALREWGKHTN